MPLIVSIMRVAAPGDVAFALACDQLRRGAERHNRAATRVRGLSIAGSGLRIAINSVIIVVNAIEMADPLNRAGFVAAGA